MTYPIARTAIESHKKQHSKDMWIRGEMGSSQGTLKYSQTVDKRPYEEIRSNLTEKRRDTDLPLQEGSNPGTIRQR